MKSTKLLAALAATALFAACAEEEIVKIDNAPQKMEEVVGAKLIGVDLSLNLDKDGGATRLADGLVRTWDKSDVIGLGWVVNGQPWQDQDGAAPTSDVLYANHLFSWVEGEGVDEFASRGNFYQGWHFAYYPWSNMSKTAKKRFEVNPPQLACEGEQNPLYLRMSQALNISSRKFLTENQVGDNNVLTEKFMLYPAMNFMNIKTSPAAETEFAKTAEGTLGAKTIKSVAVEVGQAIFAEAVELAPSKLPEANTDKTVERANFNDALYTTVLSKGHFAKNANNENDLYTDLVDNELSTSVTTDVSATGYKVSDNTQLITIVTPAEVSLAKENVVVTVTLSDNSYFEIKYEDGAVEGTSAYKNNEAIKKMIAAWGAEVEGYETIKGIYSLANNQSVKFEFELYEDIYYTEATFMGVSNIKEWEDAMNMIDWLGCTEKTVYIDGVIDFEEGIKMPETACELTVERAKIDQEGNTVSTAESLENFYLNITGNITTANWWPANLDAQYVKVEVASGVTVNNAHEIKALQVVNNGNMDVPAEMTLASVRGTITENCRVINNGTISLGYKSKVERVENNKTIEVVYGSYVTLFNDVNNGDIVYLVSDSDVKNPYQIKNVIDPTAEKTAHVNVLRFDAANGISEFSFTKEGSAGYDDPYTGAGTGAYGDAFIAEIEELIKPISLDVNDVAVSTSKELTVKNVVLVGQNASLKGISVTDGMTVNVGKNDQNVVECATISGGLTTDGNVKATTINGDVNASNCNIIAAASISGNVTTDGDVTAESIVGALNLSGNGVVSVKSIGGAVTINGGTVVATVAIAGGVTAENATIDARTIGGNVSVLGGVNNIESNKIKGDVTVHGGTVTMDVETINNALTNDGVVTINGNDNVYIKSITNNATMNVNTDVNVETIILKKGVSVTNVQEEPEKIIWYTTDYQQGGTTKGKIEQKVVTPSTGTIVTVESSDELSSLTIENGSKVVLAPGEYIIPAAAKGKEVTFVGTGNPEDVKVAVTKVGTGGENCDYGLDGSNVTFEGITITTNSSTYIGYARCNGTYKNCIINGTYTLYGISVFEECTFNVTGDVYNIWTWGAPSAKFVDCTFNSDGKSMLLYGTADTNLTIENCVFNDKGGLDDLKAAVEIGNDYNKSYQLIVNNTVVNGYEINDKGIVTGTTLWANKNSMSKDNLNVVVDGVDVY